MEAEIKHEWDRRPTRRGFWGQVSVLGAAAAAGGFWSGGGARAASSLWDAEAMEFLRGMARATVAASRVAPGARRRGVSVNTSGVVLITPGGNYPYFWVRDYAMSLDCGLIGPEEMLPQLRLIARRQNGPAEVKLVSGAIIPAFAIADHLRLDGLPVYVPGPISAGQLQGLGPWGPLPPADDHYYFIHIAWAYWRDTGDAGFLTEPVEGMPLLDRLIRAFHAVETDPQTGAVKAEPPRRMVGFGFDDTIYMLGSLCFATLLRWRAAGQLAALCAAAGRPGDGEYGQIAGQIASNLVPVFAAPEEMGGWLRAATERCRQPDVWATLFALHLGVLPAEAERRARETVAQAVAAAGHVIEYQGAVRHVPTTHDYSATSAWEDSQFRRGGEYQNGGYWHTPTGWLIEALHPLDPGLARGVFDRFIAHLREYDFRKVAGSRIAMGKFGAPWECFSMGLDHAQNPVYMTSVTLPLAVLQKMG